MQDKPSNDTSDKPFVRTMCDAMKAKIDHITSDEIQAGGCNGPILYYEVCKLAQEGFLTPVEVPGAAEESCLLWLPENHVTQVIAVFDNTEVEIKPFENTVFWTREVSAAEWGGLSLGRSDIIVMNKLYFWFGNRNTAMHFKLTFVHN